MWQSFALTRNCKVFSLRAEGEARGQTDEPMVSRSAVDFVYSPLPHQTNKNSLAGPRAYKARRTTKEFFQCGS